MIPRKIHLDKPAIVMELKWDKNAEGAIQQIKDKEYIDALKDENQEEISNFFLISDCRQTWCWVLCPAPFFF